MANDTGRGKNLVICADDFGMDPAIDEGILRLAALGRLSAISCMPFGPGFQRNAAALAASRLQLGLHLNFTEDMRGQGSCMSVNFTEAMGGPGSSGPAESAEAICSEGLCLPLPRLISAAYARRLDATAITAQIARQLDQLEAVLGRRPDFVDGHQHVHQLPVIRDCLLRELARRYAPGDRPWLRSTLAAAQPGIPLRLRVKAGIIQALGARHFQRQARALGFALNTGFLGVYDFTGGETAYRRLLQFWLRAAGDGALLMCHPAAAAASGDVLVAQRVAEFNVLAEDRTGRLLHDAGLIVA